MRPRSLLFLSLLVALPVAAQQPPPPPAREAPREPSRPQQHPQPARQQHPARPQAQPPATRPPAQPPRQQAQQPPARQHAQQPSVRQQAQQPSARQQAQPRPQGQRAPAARPAAPAAPPPAAAPAPAPPPLIVEPGKGTETGLPIPRYAAMRSNEVNMRVGPGREYPAEWTYRRRELPVEIIRESGNWRQVRDLDGITGWVSAATLTGRRTFIVKGNEVMLRRRPEADAAPVARLMPGVVGRVRACAERLPWCEVQAGDHRGFVPRAAIWGVSADEAIGG